MVTTVNLPDGLHERLKQLAEQEHRSMNATIVVAVEEKRLVVDFLVKPA
jgi:predicted transcriptional regulator